MSYDDFLKQWLGKSYCETPAFGAQCVSLAKLYIESVDGITLGSFGGSAINGWNTGSPFDSKWKRVRNSPNAVPNLGDVVFFAPHAGDPQGHVAIVARGATSTVLPVIEQNAATGNGKGIGGDAIRVHNYDYKTPLCLGWFSFVGA